MPAHPEKRPPAQKSWIWLAIWMMSTTLATAQVPPGIAELQINTSTEHDQIRPKIAADAAGEFVVVWTRQERYRDSLGDIYITDRGLYGQRFDHEGRAQGGEFEVNTVPTYRIYGSDVARAADGDFMVVWGNPGVRAQLYNADGDPRGSETEVDEGGPLGYYPAVTSDSDGNWLVVWKGPAPNAPISGRRYDTVSETWGSPFEISEAGSEGTYPSVAADLEDRFLVVWRRISDADPRILGRRISNAGEKLGSELRVNQSPAPFSVFIEGDDLGELAVGVDPEGRYAVAWNSLQMGSYGPTAVRYLDGDLQPMGYEVLFGRSTRSPALAVGGAGELLVSSSSEATYFEGFGALPRASFPLSWLGLGGSPAIAIGPQGQVMAVLEHGELYRRLLPPPPEGGVFQLVDTRERPFTELVEQSTPVDVTVVRTGGFGEASVGSFLEDLTTTRGQDYREGAISELFFAENDTWQILRFQMYEDRQREGNELLRVGLRDPVGAVLREPSSVEVTIFDDDSFLPGEGPLARGARLMANEFQAGAQREPRLAVNRREEILVVWRHLEQDREGAGIHARLFGAAGEPRGGEFRISTGTPEEVSTPAVDASPDGSFLVTWIDERREVRGRRVFATPGGPRLEPELTLARSPHPGGSGYGHEVAVDGSGDFVVAWNAEAPRPGQYLPSRPFVATQRFEASGSARGDLVTTYTAGSHSALSSSADGRFLVVWNDFDGNFLGSRFDADGRRVPGGDLRVMPDSDYLLEPRPTIVGPPDRPFLVVWQKALGEPPSPDGFLSNAGLDLYARRFDAGGTPLGERFQVNSFEPGSQSRARSASSPSGISALVWTSAGQLAPGKSSIFARRFRSDGRFFGSRFPVRPSRFSQSSPDVAMAADGDFVVAWEEEVAPEKFDIFVQRFSGSSCISGMGALCLGQGRFRVEVRWKDFSGGEGRGREVPLADDTGVFWFFSPDNLELVVKVLDGRELTGHFWVYYGSLSNTQFELTITDTETGETKTYTNPAGRFASRGDVLALPDSGSLRSRPAAGPPAAGPPAAGPPAAAGRSTLDPRSEGAGCEAGPEALCLNLERFRVEVDWEDPGGQTGAGRAVPITGDTGAFYFFSPNNLELAVKVLDGREITGSFWVFYASLSDVGFTVRVTDTVTGRRRTYFNPPGRFASVGDVDALPGEASPSTVPLSKVPR